MGLAAEGGQRQRRTNLYFLHAARVQNFKQTPFNMTLEFVNFESMYSKIFSSKLTEHRFFNFEPCMEQAEKFAKSGGSIYPGFHDFYAEGGAGENLVSS